jgi:hypothetical protein
MAAEAVSSIQGARNSIQGARKATRPQATAQVSWRSQAIGRAGTVSPISPVMSACRHLRRADHGVPALGRVRLRTRSPSARATSIARAAGRAVNPSTCMRMRKAVGRSDATKGPVAEPAPSATPAVLVRILPCWGRSPLLPDAASCDVASQGGRLAVNPMFALQAKREAISSAAHRPAAALAQRARLALLATEHPAHRCHATKRAAWLAGRALAAARAENAWRCVAAIPGAFRVPRAARAIQRRPIRAARSWPVMSQAPQRATRARSAAK